MPRYDSTGKELPRKTDNEYISSFRVEVEEMRSNALSDLAVRIDTERKLARGEHVDSIFENDPDCKKMISELKKWEEESLTTADQFRQVSNIMRTMTNDKKETDRTKSDTMRIETLQEHQIEILDKYDLWGHPEYNDNRYNW